MSLCEPPKPQTKRKELKSHKPQNPKKKEQTPKTKEKKLFLCTGKFEQVSPSSLSTLPLFLPTVTMASLSFKLNAEDLAVFQGLQASALLPSLAQPGEGELVELFKQRKREEHKKQMEPYADYLEHELTKKLEARKASILDELKSSKGTSFSVKLFQWKTVLYHESLDSMRRRATEMTPEQLRLHSMQMQARRNTIEENGWESMFGVEYLPSYGYDEDYGTQWVKYPVKVDRIFRQSDLALRLSLKLGPNFFPYTDWETVEDAGDESEHGYKVYTKTLCVRYYPFGVNKDQMTRLLAVAKNQANRMTMGEVVGLCSGEYATGHEGMNILPPPPLPAPVSLLGGKKELTLQDLAAALRKGDVNRCFCGCADDESE